MLILNETVVESLESEFSGTEGMFDRIVGLFRDESFRQVLEIREAIEANDFAKCARMAHSLKGSASAMGADRFSSLCSWLEGKSRELPVDQPGDPAFPADIPERLLHERSAYFLELDKRAAGSIRHRKTSGQ